MRTRKKNTHTHTGRLLVVFVVEVWPSDSFSHTWIWAHLIQTLNRYEISLRLSHRSRWDTGLFWLTGLFYLYLFWSLLRLILLICVIWTPDTAFLYNWLCLLNDKQRSSLFPERINKICSASLCTPLEYEVNNNLRCCVQTYVGRTTWECIFWNPLNPWNPPLKLIGRSFHLFKTVQSYNTRRQKSISSSCSVAAQLICPDLLKKIRNVH